MKNDMMRAILRGLDHDLALEAAEFLIDRAIKL